MTTQTETPAAPAKPEAEKRDYMMVSISVPPELHKELEEAATAEKLSLSVLVRRVVAKARNFDIVAFERSRRRGRVKYSTEEERVAAQRNRAATVKALMERYNKGEITVSDEEIAAAAASIKPRDRKPATPAATTPAASTAPATPPATPAGTPSR